MELGSRFLCLVGCLTLTGCAAVAPTTIGDAGSTGDELLYLSNRNGNYDIYLLNITTGATRQLTQTDSDEYGLSWSPGGDRIAFGCAGWKP
ncbi:MAG: TolB family protein [Phycisphaerales bacterium]